MDDIPDFVPILIHSNKELVSGREQFRLLPTMCPAIEQSSSPKSTNCGTWQPICTTNGWWWWMVKAFVRWLVGCWLLKAGSGFIRTVAVLNGCQSFAIVVVIVVTLTDRTSAVSFDDWRLHQLWRRWSVLYQSIFVYRWKTIVGQLDATCSVSKSRVWAIVLTYQHFSYRMQLI